MAREAITIIGTVIGAYFGNPQLGYAIGAMVGSAVDPERIAGPRAGDIARQTASEGVPCPLFAGTAGASGNLIYKSEVRKVIVDEQQGKGGGPIVETERLYCTFAIRIGASLFYGPGNRDGLVGLSRIWEDEKLVYDVTPTSQMMAESAKFASDNGLTFYPGSDSQLPDPSIEAIEGVGNVPAYVGRAYVVFANKDVTDRRGAVPQYRFEVSAGGSEAPVETVSMVEYENDAASGGTVAGNITVHQHYLDVRAFTSITAALTSDGPCYVRVIAPEAAGGAVLWDSGWMGDSADQTALTLALSATTQIRVYDPTGPGFTDITDPTEIGLFRLNLNGAIVPAVSVSGYFSPPYGIGENAIVQIIRPGGVNTPTGAEWSAFEPDPAEVTEPYIALPELPGAIYGLTTGTTWFTPFATGLGVVTPGTDTLDDVLLAIGAICKMDASLFNVSAVAARTVRGLVLASQDYTGADAMNSLRWVYQLDALDADGVISFIARGGAIKAALTEDDLVDDQDDAEQEEEIRSGDERRAAKSEQPLKVNLFFPDPIIGYALSKATSPNHGDRPDSVTEINLEVPVVLDGATEAPQLADILEKVSDADAQGEVVRVVPEEFARLTGSDCITLTERGITRRYRIDKTREGEGRSRLHMRYDRVSNYTSKATQAATPSPAQPPSSLQGPTVLKVLNGPGIVDGDDRIGVRVALGAVLDGWAGATVQYSSDSGATWTTAGYFNTRAVMGTLLSALPYASALVSDWANTIHVQLFDSRDLEAVTLAQLLDDGNGCAVIKPSGQVELIQYEGVTDLGANAWRLGDRLLRGRLGTTPSAHAVGAYFVTLDSTRFIELPSSLIGRELMFRAPSFGTSPELAEVVTFTWDPFVGQTELPPASLAATRDSGVLSVAWNPRHRFGSGLSPIASVNFDGFRVTATDGAATLTTNTTAASVDLSDAGFSGPVDVTVEAMNRITGAGTAAELTGIT